MYKSIKNNFPSLIPSILCWCQHHTSFGYKTILLQVCFNNPHQLFHSVHPLLHKGGGEDFTPPFSWHITSKSAHFELRNKFTFHIALAIATMTVSAYTTRQSLMMRSVIFPSPPPVSAGSRSQISPAPPYGRLMNISTRCRNTPATSPQLWWSVPTRQWNLKGKAF